LEEREQKRSKPRGGEDVNPRPRQTFGSGGLLDIGPEFDDRAPAELSSIGVDYAGAAGTHTQGGGKGTLDTMASAKESVFEPLKPGLETWAGKISSTTSLQ
jgi:hypothetical protein